MASLRSVHKTKEFLRQINVHQRPFSSSAAVFLPAWNKDWLPGPRPGTEEEREAAAKSYGMLPQDYESYPDDGTGVGDYPKLPIKGNFSRSGNTHYSFPDYKRDYGEVLHYDYDIYLESRVDLAQPWIPRWKGICFSLGFFTILYMFVYICNPYPTGQDELAKQYPFDKAWALRGKNPAERPVKNYYLEPAD